MAFPFCRMHLPLLLKGNRAETSAALSHLNPIRNWSDFNLGSVPVRAGLFPVFTFFFLGCNLLKIKLKASVYIREVSLYSECCLSNLYIYWHICSTSQFLTLQEICHYLDGKGSFRYRVYLDGLSFSP